MKKRITILATALLMILAFAGCGNNKLEKQDDTLLVYTSFYTLSDFTEKIGGEHVTVVNIMPPNAEPHDWEPTAQDMRNLEDADVFIYNGAGIDGWVDKVLGGLTNDNLVVVKTSEALSLIQNEDHNNHDDHNHEEHDYGEFDPHTWLSPKNASQEMSAIAEGLKQADPNNASTYDENLGIYTEQCAKLSESFHDAINPLKNHEIVVAHAAYGYLCDEFGLTQMAVREFSPDEEPSPQRMAEIIDFVEEHQISTVFFEDNGSADVAKTIAQDAGVVTDVLYPIESLSAESKKQGEDYFSLMEKNREALVKALKD